MLGLGSEGICSPKRQTEPATPSPLQTPGPSYYTCFSSGWNTIPLAHHGQPAVHEDFSDACAFIPSFPQAQIAIGSILATLGKIVLQ